MDFLHQSILLASGAGVGLAALVVAWFNFLPFWKKNALGHRGGKIGAIAYFHQIATMIGVIPAAVFAGRYMGEGAVINEWVIFAIMFGSFFCLLLIHSSARAANARRETKENDR